MLVTTSVRIGGGERTAGRLWHHAAG
jgi:hypothetical protein